MEFLDLINRVIELSNHNENYCEELKNLNITLKSMIVNL
jgi:hypothetical protein